MHPFLRCSGWCTSFVELWFLAGLTAYRDVRVRHILATNKPTMAQLLERKTDGKRLHIRRVTRVPSMRI